VTPPLPHGGGDGRGGGSDGPPLVRLIARSAALSSISTSDTTMIRRTDIYTGRALARAAVQYGEQLGFHKYRLPNHGDCENPVCIEVTASSRYGAGRVLCMGEPGIPPRIEETILVDILARCRKCAKCLRAKRRLWALRAGAECFEAPRTWFVTLTFTPTRQYQALCEVRLGSDERAEYEFQKLAGILAGDVTKWLKRVRAPLKSKDWSAVSFRYLMVAEAHKRIGRNGQVYDFDRPHFHLLLHEKPGQTIVHARLRHHWKALSGGALFDARLVNEPHEVNYVTKYVAKDDAMSRVRASRGYGSQLLLNKSVDEVQKRRGSVQPHDGNTRPPITLAKDYSPLLAGEAEGEPLVQLDDGTLMLVRTPILQYAPYIHEIPFFDEEEKDDAVSQKRDDQGEHGTGQHSRPGPARQ
jgi:hypothetical protein